MPVAALPSPPHGRRLRSVARSCPSQHCPRPLAAAAPGQRPPVARPRLGLVAICSAVRLYKRCAITAVDHGHFLPVVFVISVELRQTGNTKRNRQAVKYTKLSN
ncbi:hypothetical protein GUJ93_ZPchr0001g31168 [Zizania palustris]|uniref:Uncharacterized protein n=1 Tax=Zizania palustris TaxID=103762 RepID=A0A8J5S5V5_ZIZPA|nr:hypothetical protein GUJ93_ZPchr0001g31168 [Zizania palustris]